MKRSLRRLGESSSNLKITALILLVDLTNAVIWGFGVLGFWGFG